MTASDLDHRTQSTRSVLLDTGLGLTRSDKQENEVKVEEKAVVNDD